MLVSSLSCSRSTRTRILLSFKAFQTDRQLKIPLLIYVQVKCHAIGGKFSKVSFSYLMPFNYIIFAFEK